MEKFLYTPPGELKKQFTPAEQQEYDSVTAQLLAYYQKALNPEQRRLLDDHFKKTHQQVAEHPDVEHFEPLKHFTERERKNIFNNLGSMQLSFGCNGGCEKCGLDAIAGVRDNLPFALVEQFVERYKDELAIAKPFLYWASDPLDYRSPKPGGGTYTYRDVEELFQTKVGYRPYVSTVIPKGAEEVVESMRTIDRLSIGKNKDFLARRGLLDRINEIGQPINRKARDNYYVEMIDLGAMNSRFENEGEISEGIGCFDGALITPRGTYSVIQSKGWNPHAPQRQFIVPYLGESNKNPQAGDDIREVLQHHLPVLRRSAGTRSEYAWNRKQKPYHFYVTHATDDSQQLLLIGYRGTVVQNAVSQKTLETLISKFIAYKRACHAYYSRHTTAAMATLKIGRYANAERRYPPADQMPERIRQFMFDYLDELEMYGYKSDPFGEAALELILSKIPTEDLPTATSP